MQAVLKGAAAEGRCTAGEEVAVQLQLRDQYGAAGSALELNYASECVRFGPGFVSQCVQATQSEAAKASLFLCRQPSRGGSGCAAGCGGHWRSRRQVRARC
jgi:hypothetical protein